MARSVLAVVLTLGLLVEVFCLPANTTKLRRDVSDNDISDEKGTEQPSNTPSVYTPVPYDDDDDDFPESTNTSSGGGSNIFSLLNFVTALFPSSSGSNTLIGKVIQDILKNVRIHVSLNRKDPDKISKHNVSKRELTTVQFERQDNDVSSGESSESESSCSSESGEDNKTGETSGNSDSDKNNAAEESIENNSVENASKQDSVSESNSNESDEDSDERPGGDGQGGGVLGFLSGLSGGDGESDLGTLLAAVSGIVLNLSGDGFDLNGVIASGLGLFVGLLSEGEENPGSIVASYLLTSLDTITGGGAKNNGAFFGKFISRLVKGTIAVGGGSEESSEENSDEEKVIMSDSVGFIKSFIMGLLGDMSKGSSVGSGS